MSLTTEIENTFISPPIVTRRLPAELGCDAHSTSNNIGPYRVVSVLGRGGMGSVFKVRRVSEDGATPRHYALKVIRGNSNARLLFRRFEREAKALARLSHPNIAGFTEVGYSADWEPYLVMELVDGVPLLEYAREERLGLEGRLRLFAQVAEAVAHAHAAKVLHRDIKPSNILVCETDLGPQAKLIDFGVTKLIDELEEDGLTQDGGIVGTPGYASPEQVGFVDRPMDGRADVFSLGLVLYELLVGALPYDTERLARLPLYRRIREMFMRPICPPARRLQRMTHAELALIAFERGLDAARFQRIMGGRLGQANMRALVIDPNHRMSSAAEMAHEVRSLSDGKLAGAQGFAAVVAWLNRVVLHRDRLVQW
ncbi:Non-specific serine/threonine protein kinase [Sulfidibacter corallicola]